MKIILIRHGMTAGNLSGRYIGVTDEPLCREGADVVRSRVYPPCDILFSSPMKRCIETAKLIYPALSPVIDEDFRECDFGDFEGKNYSELNGNAEYQRWIDSGGTLPFPNGESPDAFRSRCHEAFLRCVRPLDCGTAAFVVHGGTIMSIMSGFGGGDYFGFRVKNACGYTAEFDGEKLTLITEIQ